MALRGLSANRIGCCFFICLIFSVSAKTPRAQSEQINRPLTQGEEDSPCDFPRDAAATRPTHSFGVGLGGAFDQLRDDVLARLRWIGFGPSLRFSYTYAGQRTLHEADLKLLMSFLKNRYDHPAAGLGLFAGYGVGRRLDWKPLLGTVHVGARLDASIQPQFYWSWDEEHIYWLTAYGLGPQVHWYRSFDGPRRVTLSLFSPIVALTSRPPEHRYYKIGRLNQVSYYFEKPHEELGLTSVHEYLAASLVFAYERQIRGRLSLGALLTVDYKTHSEPERFRSLTMILSLRLVFHSKPEAGR